MPLTSQPELSKESSTAAEGPRIGRLPVSYLPVCEVGPYLPGVKVDFGRSPRSSMLVRQYSSSVRV